MIYPLVKLHMETVEDVDQSLADALKLREYALERGNQKLLDDAQWVIDEYLDLRLEMS